MRLVIKIGTSTLAHPSGHLNIKRVEHLCKVIADIKNAGNEIIMVSSGAIGMGVGKLGLKSRPKDMPTKQAAAAVGQCELMYIYDKLFSEYHHNVAQLLITNDNFKETEYYDNFINTLNKLLELEVIPVINENDTIATEEIAVGDNDTLAAKVAAAVEANLLILLSDIDGLYTADPLKIILPPSLGRDRIVAVTAEGMAPQQPPGSKNQPLHGKTPFFIVNTNNGLRIMRQR